MPGRGSSFGKIACCFAPLLLLACGSDKAAPGYATELDPTLRGDAGVDAAAPDAAAGDAGTQDASADANGGPGRDAAMEGDSSSAGQDARSAETPLSASERLLVSDPAGEAVHVFDPATKQSLFHRELGAAARLAAGAGDRVGYLLLRGGQVRVLDVGLVPLEDGADESTLAPIKLLDATFAGTGPTYVLPGAGRAALFFSGEARAQLLDETALLTGTESFPSIAAGLAHQGVAIPTPRGALVSFSAAGAQATSLLAYDASGAPDPALQVNCAGARSAAARSGEVLVSCDGTLRRIDTTSRTTSDVSTPEGLPALDRIVAHPSAPLYLGTQGSQACLIAASATCRTLKARVLQAAFDPGGKYALLLLSDGRLYLHDLVTFEERGQISVTGATPEGAAAEEHAGLAVGHRYAYVSDPSENRIRVLHAASGSVVDDIALSFAPGSLALLRYR